MFLNNIVRFQQLGGESKDRRTLTSLTSSQFGRCRREGRAGGRRSVSVRKPLPSRNTMYRSGMGSLCVLTMLMASRMVYGAELLACSPSSAFDIIVESAEDLAGLVEQTNCSGGEFIVSWRGGVVFENPIVVGNFTSLSIIGNGTGAVLDGGGATRLFEAAEGTTLMLENVELRNATATRWMGGGGAILADGAQLTINATSCNFTENTSPEDGGVILSTGGLASISFTDCRFERNFAEHSGGVMRAHSATRLSATNCVFFGNIAYGRGTSWVSGVGHGGALYLSGGQPEVAFVRCDFKDNNSSDNGGAVNYDAAGRLSVVSTTVSMNWAYYTGGGIWVNGVEEVKVVDSVFEDNFVSEKSTWSNNIYYGGGLYLFGQAMVTIQSSNFSRNGAEKGGGVWMMGNLTVNVEDSLFHDNMASSYGGAVYLAAYGGNGDLKASFNNVMFVGNSCPGYGGAVFSNASGSGDLSFNRTNFVNNSAVYRSDLLSSLSSYRGGGYLASGRGLHTTADGCVFEGNQAGAVGGAVSIDGGTFSASNCDFYGNVARNGGAINAAVDDLELFSSEISLRGGSMRRNVAESPSCYGWTCGHGGAVHAELGAEAVLYGVVIEENSAEFGGSISLSTDARVSCTYVNFSSNSAAVAGGAVHVWGNGSRFFSNHSVYWSNAADAQGSTSTSSGSSLYGTNSEITSSSSSTGPTRDSAGASGGAVSVTDGGTVYITNSAVRSNRADGRGGAVFCGSAANVTVIGTEFLNHESGVAGHIQGHGGACAAVDGCRLRLVESYFEGNSASAPSGGALSVEGGSEMSAFRCTFTKNHASGGGAVYGSGSDTSVSLESCSLENNTAQKEGGALRMYSLESLQLTRCNIDFNKAGELGGGIHCYECDIKASSCSFEGNSANGDGGAIRLSYASSALITLCRFTENKALYDGGAIAMDAAVGEVDTTDEPDADTQAQNDTDSDDSDSVHFACSDTSFFGNAAGERGGTIYSTADSWLELDNCNSTSNNAALGGSLYISSSECDLTNCLFNGDYNTVPTDATVFSVDSVIKANKVIFSDSFKNSSMLAIYAGSGTNLQALNCSFVGWASSNVVLADSTGILEMDSCDFSGSMAQSLVSVADGDNVQPAVIRNARIGTANYEAINYLAGDTSIEGNASTFGSNLAGCDSNPCTEGCVEGDLGVYCASYENVVDFDDTSLGSAGTISLTSDEEVYAMYPDEPTTFLYLVGNSTEKQGPVLWKLDWVDDQSSLEWSALPSTGLVYPGDSIAIFLQGDVASNWNGESQTVVTAEAPHQDDVESSSVTVNITFVYCDEGYYWDSSESECISCSLLRLNPEGVVCDEEGALLETLELVEGFWRAEADSRMIRKCFNDDACVGSDGDRLVTANDYCDDGYMGPYCAVCMAGYTIGVSHTCHSCDSTFRAGMVVIMALTGVVMVVGIVMVINDLIGNPALTDLSETYFSAISRRLRKVPFHKLKIPLVVFQIMTQYAAITSIEFPPVFQTFLTAISVINLDLGWLFRAVCLIELNFYGRLLAATIGPLAVLFVLLGTYICTCKKHGLRPPTREVADHAMFPVIRASPRSSETDSEYSVLWRVQDKHITVAVTIAFLLYSTVSTVIFQTFTCDELEDIDKRYLRADYAIECDSDKHKVYQIYAGAMILVYPIGIPLVFFVLLFRKRRLINPSKEVQPDIMSHNGNEGNSDGDGEPDSRLLDRRIAHTAFLWGAYRPGAYYFEVLECFRRLLLTGCLVFILPNSAGQAAVACVLSVVTVGIFALVQPYRDPNDHMAYTLGALVIFLTMFMGLVVKVDLADEETQSQEVLSALLIILTVGLLFVAVLDCLWETRRLTTSSDNDGGHIFLRRRETKNVDREKEREKEQLADDRYKTGGALYAPKLLDVPINRASAAKKKETEGGLDEEHQGSAAVEAPIHGGRRRGSLMFVQSASADPDYVPRVAIAGTSCHLHPSEAGAVLRDSDSLEIGGDHSTAQGAKPVQFSAAYSPPSHSRSHSHGHLVPAEGAPEGNEGEDPLSAGGSIGGEKQRSGESKRRSKSSRRKGGGRSRRKSGDFRGGMRPAMPAAGPADEMRPSPEPDNGSATAPGPWNT